MEIIYFSEPGIGIQPKYSEHPQGGIVGNALLFYEGTHRDNKGREHECPADRVHLLAVNTNKEFNLGRDIPLKFDHKTSLVDEKGGVNKFGKMASPVSCRLIEESDLANPRLKHLIGRLGAFAQVHVLDKIDAVKNKTIQALSAGIDPVKNKFVEISAVSDPSLAGASLLFSRYSPQVNFSNHGITDYNQAVEKVEAWDKPYRELLKKFEIFAGTLQAIEAQKDSEEIGFNTNNLKRNAVEQFVEDLVDHLEIEFEDEQEQTGNPGLNPYEPDLLGNHNQNYSDSESENVLNFSGSKRQKRRRLGA